MTDRRSSPSVLIQVAALAVLAVIASQVVTFVVLLTSPPPRPAGFSAAAAADAALGRPARTTDGRVLVRRLSDRPGVRKTTEDPIAALIAGTVARRANVPVDSVRVALDRRGPPGQAEQRGLTIQTPQRLTLRRATGGATDEAGTRPVETIRQGDVRITVNRSPMVSDQGTAVPARPVVPIRPVLTSVEVFASSNAQRFDILTERLTFQPFTTSVRLPDGRWATVAPPRGLIDPWQMRVLISLAISLLLLAPIVWLMARRLTRPIRVFAEAAQRLGDDPDAAPLKPSGPAEVRTAITAFNEMQASLRDHMRRRTQTVAAIAHDLRTPLTRLRFRAEQAPEHLRDRMAADVEEMDALIGQAMAYVRGETATERRERLDLADLARVCAEGFAETGADVTFKGEALLPIEGDPAALRRAVGNLIDNAVKFAGSASVHAAIEGEKATIVVSDNGPGLEASELDAVFEPFHRGERSRNRQTGGTGLGLAVARQAARAAGGDVILRNRPEGGLEAVLLLPTASAA